MYFNGSSGYFEFNVNYSKLVIITLLITFFGTKGIELREKSSSKVKKEKSSFITKVKVVSMNIPLLIILIFVTTNTMSFKIQNGAMLFFFKYNYGNVGLFAIYALVTLGITSLFVMISPLLAASGYVANVDQTPEALHGILFSVTIVLVIAGVIRIIAMYFHKLDSAQYATIVSEIKARKS